MSQRRVLLSGPLERPLVTDVAAQLMTLDGLSADPLTVIVNSEGGGPDHALALIDVLALLRAPVEVEVMGRAVGPAGVVVAAAPGVRRIGASASLSIALGRDGTRPDEVSRPGERISADRLRQVAEQEADIRRRLAVAVGSRCGLPLDQVLSWFDRSSAWRGLDAVEAGLVDEVR